MANPIATKTPGFFDRVLNSLSDWMGGMRQEEPPGVPVVRTTLPTAASSRVPDHKNNPKVSASPGTRSASSPVLKPIYRAMSEPDATLASQVTSLQESWDPLRAIVLLHQVCKSDRPDIVDFLIARAVDVDGHDKEDRTSLLVAAGHGNLDIAQKLLAAGANPNSVSRGGETPLLAAIACGAEDVVSFLLAQGASIQQVDHFNWTPLMNAVAKHQGRCVRILLMHGADAKHSDNFGQNALTLAVKTGQGQTTALLLGASVGGDVGSGSQIPTPPDQLAWMAGARHDLAVDMLSERKTSLAGQPARLLPLHELAASDQRVQPPRSLRKEQGRREELASLLGLAATAGKADIVLMLMEADVDLGAALERHGALAAAVRNGHVAVIALLMAEVRRQQGLSTQWMGDLEERSRSLLHAQAKQDIISRFRDPNGHSLYMTAAQSGQTAAMIALLDAGLDMADERRDILLFALNKEAPSPAMIDLLLCDDPAVLVKDGIPSQPETGKQPTRTGGPQSALSHAAIQADIATYIEFIHDRGAPGRQSGQGGRARLLKKLCLTHGLRYMVGKALLDTVDALPSTQISNSSLQGSSGAAASRTGSWSSALSASVCTGEDSYTSILGQRPSIASIYALETDVDTALCLTRLAQQQVAILLKGTESIDNMNEFRAST